MSGKEKTNTSKPAEILKLEQELGIELVEVTRDSYKNNNYSFNEKGEIISLNLSNNELKTIPDLSRFPQLQELHLSSNQINKIEGLDKLSQLQYLNLSYNQINKIEGLDKLSQLQYLFLSSNQINKIEGLDKLSQLQELNLSYNQINKIEGLDKLSQLQYLNLSYNQINKIEGLDKLSQLQYLNLSYNQINKIEGLDKLSQLQYLFLLSNQINKIERLDKLSQLQYLDLSSNQINKIEGLDKLSQLQYLYLSDNQINKIEGLDKLSQLQYLNLSYNQINKIEELDTLSQLHQLYLYSNQINKIEGLDKLNQLHQLYLYSNQINKIEGLDKLNQLHQLYLYSNQINKIEGLDKLSQLQKLDLSGNQISSIKDWMINTDHPDIQYLSIHSNPFVEETDLVLQENSNHLELILNYLSIQQDKEKVNQTTTLTLPVKMMLLGNHAAGKSSFVSYWQNGEPPAIPVGSTHILDIQRYPQEGKEIPEVMIYDFGGQDYYHGVYQAFFTLESLNLLLWHQESNRNATRTGEDGIQTRDFTYEYWLYQLRYAFNKRRNGKVTSSEPVLILQTHADQPGEKRDVFKGETDAFHVVHDLFISLSPEAIQEKPYFRLDLEACLEKIKEQIELKKESREVPAYYKEFLQHILTSEEEDCVPVDSLLAVYPRKPLENETDEDILTYLKTELSQLALKGMVLYYPESEELKEVVWKNPAVTIRHIHEHILSKESMKKYQGIVPKNIFHRICRNEHIRKLLLNEKVIFYDHSRFQYIIPGYLPLSEKDDKVHGLMTFGFYQPNFTLKFTKFIPFGLINQLICYYGDKSDLKHVWRDQVVFTHDKDIQVWIVLDFTCLEIKVSIRPRKELSSSRLKDMELAFYQDILFLYWGQESDRKTLSKYYDQLQEEPLSKITGKSIKKEISAKLAELFSEEGLIAQTNPFIQTSQKIRGTRLWERLVNPLSSTSLPEPPDDLYLSVDDTWFVPYHEMVKESTEQVVGYGRKAGTSAVDSEVKKIQRTSLYYNFITDKNFKKMKKIFISYSRADYDYKERLKTHLNILGLFDIADNWSCDKIKIGLWHDQIQKELEESDLIIFMLSADFFNSPYIREQEVKKAMDMIIAGRKKQVLCVIVSDFIQLGDIVAIREGMPVTGQQEALFKLADYQYLPYGLAANPVTGGNKEAITPLYRHPYPDMAYKEITEQVKRALSL